MKWSAGTVAKRKNRDTSVTGRFVLDPSFREVRGVDVIADVTQCHRADRGEASGVSNRFRKLTQSDQEAIIAFL